MRAVCRLLAAAVASAAVAGTAFPQTVDGRGRLRAAEDARRHVGGAGRARPAGQAATVTYRVASGGSVVEETLFPGTPHEMISMYHLVDGELVLTHYCAMANQPRMRLDRKASTPDRLVFAFDGGTNFDPAKDTHVHSGVLEWKGETLHSTGRSTRAARKQARTSSCSPQEVAVLYIPGGRCRCQSVISWYAAATATSVSSENARPSSCSDVGSRSLPKPIGTATAGRPARLPAGMVAGGRAPRVRPPARGACPARGRRSRGRSAGRAACAWGRRARRSARAARRAARAWRRGTASRRRSRPRASSSWRSRPRGRPRRAAASPSRSR